MTKAFNGDEILLQRVKDLVERHGINLIVETGCFAGDTTLELAELAFTLSCEINKEYAQAAYKRFLGNKSISLHQNSSELAIKEFHQTGLLKGKNVLFFLDAHWNAYNPLIDELKAIAAAGIQPVILIHDFFVPGKSTTPSASWGYDTYNGQDYNWGWVKPHVEAIYPNGYTATYNDWYEAFRGCLILEAK